MHFNTINTGILDLSAMAIRANKALRGALGRIVCQAGRKTAEATLEGAIRGQKAG